jgi:membrane-associated phospholipid phosphatase
MPPRSFTDSILARPAERFDRLMSWVLPAREISSVGGRVAAMLSHAGEMSAIWLLLLVVELISGARSVHVGAFTLIAFSSEWVITNRLIKGAISRSRPTQLERLPFGVRQPHSPSFPSGHASAAGFSIPMLMTGQLSLGLIFLGGMGICWSRVYLRLHFPSDVFVGWVWGAAIGVLTRGALTLFAP